MTDLPPTVARRVEAVCSRFRAAWQTGPPPRIEEFLVDVPAEDLPPLLRELVSLDVFFRRERGEPARVEDYFSRFANLDPAWLATAVKSRDASITRAVPIEPVRAAPGGTQASRRDATIAAPLRGSTADHVPGGPTIPGYEFLGVLGRGGMGVVYRAAPPARSGRRGEDDLRARPIRTCSAGSCGRCA